MGAPYKTILVAEVVLAALVATLVGTVTTHAQAAATKKAMAPAASADAEHGRYLANDVAMCVQCHTPRDEAGVLDTTRLFGGASVPLESPFPGQPWATHAPALAGGGTFAPEDVFSVLTTGRRRDGKVPAPPMPSFRLTAGDASAIVAYLRSISPPAR